MAEPVSPLALPETASGRSWPAQGRWTYEDYLRLPEDGRRYEVLRGVLYVTPAPLFEHQFSVGRLYLHLERVALEKDLGIFLLAPFDIRLPRRLADPVEPDLVFFRKGNAPQEGDKSFRGVPDLVIEVLSPGTRRIDQRIKREVYQEAGIPEFWMVDPKARTLVVLRLDDAGVYAEISRDGEEGVVTSATLPGLRLKVSDIFLPRV
jgi:Uma2 family endonuclease